MYLCRKCLACAKCTATGSGDETCLALRDMYNLLSDDENVECPISPAKARRDILKKAERCVCGEREQDYGSPEDNFATIADLWAVYLSKKCVGPGISVDLAPEDVAAMMALLKIARIASGSEKLDNWIDLAGYAVCGGSFMEWAPKDAHE